MEKLNAQEKDKLLKRMRRYYRIGLRTNRDWIKRAKQGYAFYFGDQWDAADRRKCESENRPALTVNKIFPVINTVSGIKRKNKQDFKVYPFKGSNQNWAQVYTTLLKDTADDAESEWETAAMFDDGIISGKGWVGLDVDYSEDPLQGDLTLERLSPFEVLEDGRDKHYNLNKGAEFVIRLKRMTKQELQDEFPDVKLDNVSYDDLAEAYGLPDASTVETEDYPEEEAYFAEHEGEGDEEEESRKLWVKQCWWKSKEYFNLLINTTTDEVRRVTDKDGIEYAKYLVDTYPDKYDFLEHQRVNNMHVTTWIGNKLLDHRDDPLQGCCKFPLVRFCAYYMEGFNIGMVDNLVDPQQEHNKRRSQVLHHLNSTANSGWIGDDDALADWSVLEDFGSKPGIIIKKRPGKVTANHSCSRITRSFGHVRTAR